MFIPLGMIFESYQVAFNWFLYFYGLILLISSNQREDKLSSSIFIAAKEKKQESISFF